RRTSSWSPGASRPLALDLDVRPGAAAVLLICPPRGLGRLAGSSNAFCATRRTTTSLILLGAGVYANTLWAPALAGDGARRSRRTGGSARGDGLGRGHPCGGD